jgi:mannose-6-phosphate isomerase-like protein (cupin superfamily)
MEKIYSICSPEILNHMIFRREDLSSLNVGRLDLSENSEFLQLAAMRIPDQISFPAHTHLDRRPSFDSLRAQEAWVVISGIVQVDYYDGDDSFQQSFQLLPGDVSVTFYGGHGYSINKGEALVYEFKSGPYEGKEIDKRVYGEK